jgi:hypothetical protein
MDHLDDSAGAAPPDDGKWRTLPNQKSILPMNHQL